MLEVPELLTCPFCGSVPEMEERGSTFTARRSVTIKCPSCGVQRTDLGNRSSLEVLKRFAAKAWNKRI